MNLSEYASHDATGLADLVRRGEVSPTELARLAAAGAERVDGRLGSLVEVYADRLDGIPGAALPDGPLRGVPVALKDLYHGEAGRECGNGSRLSEGWVPQTDSSIVRRLKAAGMVTVARATTSEWGIMGTTETAACGPTCSPWSSDHVAGGSSGGSAAAVGAGIVPVATASDGGGSIRIPAACCGTVGLKTSRGRVSFGPEAAEPLFGWAVRFVVSRSVRDTAALLDVLAGPEPGDPSLLPAPERPFAAEVGADPGRLRIAYWTAPWNGSDAHPEHAAATEATARLLAEMGHHVEEARPEFDWESYLDCMAILWSVSTAAGIDAFGQWLEREPGESNLEPATLEMLRYGRKVTAYETLGAMGHVNVVARRMGAFFGDWDVLLTPTLGHPQRRIGEYGDQGAIAPRELFSAWSDQESLLPAFNSTGQPAISLPLHQAAGGLPIGMQLVGRLGEDATLIRLAARLEEALPWAGRIPPLHVGAE